jgi:hypothetical protein
VADTQVVVVVAALVGIPGERDSLAREWGVEVQSCKYHTRNPSGDQAKHLSNGHLSPERHLKVPSDRVCCTFDRCLRTVVEQAADLLVS